MRLVPFRWLAFLVLAQALPAHAAPVEYGTKDGWGAMLLDRVTRRVSIDVVAANAHTCTVRGRLTGAALDRVEDEEGCKFKLQSKAQGVLAVVIDEAAHEACRANCGARAGFDGEYLPLPTACTQAGLARQQGEALRAYRAKRFDAAYHGWFRGLNDCEAMMHWSSVWSWRNDAAIAAAHDGRQADCQKLSQAVLADAKAFTQEGETEPFSFAPTDADVARPLVAAARHNLAKCSKAP